MKKMTEGNPLTLLITFAIPIFIGNLFQQLYTFVDLKIVSEQLGGSALASVGATSSLVFLIFGFINGLTNGFSIITAQYYGANNKIEMKRSIAATVTLSFLMMIIIGGLSLYYVKDILILLQTPPQDLEGAYVYLSTLLLGLIFTTLYNMCANILRAMGNSVVPLVFLAISASSNIGLDLLMICVFHQGIFGAAIATVMAQGLSAILCLIYILLKCPEVHLKKSDFSFTLPFLWKMISTGFSMALMFSIVSIGSVILQSGINSLGHQTVAGHTAGRKIIELFMMPLVTIGAACSTFAGQNYGAGRLDRVYRGTTISNILGFVWSALSCLILLLFPEQMVCLIAKPEEAEMIRIGSMYVTISIPYFFALVVLLNTRNVLQGLGQRIVPIIASITEMLGKVIAVQMLVPRFGYKGVCYTEPIIWVMDGLLVFITYFIYMKKHPARIKK